MEQVEQAGVATSMVARAALIKPWIFTEIKVVLTTWSNDENPLISLITDIQTQACSRTVLS